MPMTIFQQGSLAKHYWLPTVHLTVAPAMSIEPPSHRLRRKTGQPVLPAEEGQVLGVCGEAEIIDTLAARG